MHGQKNMKLCLQGEHSASYYKTIATANLFFKGFVCSSFIVDVVKYKRYNCTQWFIKCRLFKTNLMFKIKYKI